MGALAATTVATTDLAIGPMVTDMVSTTARGRLRPSLTTVSTLPTTLLPPSSPATPRSPPPPPSPLSALPTPPSPLLLEATLVPGATSPTPLEPSMLPRGRPRLSLSRTTTEDMGMATDSDTGPTDMVSTDTAAVTTTVKFCLDVLDLDATMLPTFCP